jgi:hypothetical protein
MQNSIGSVNQLLPEEIIKILNNNKVLTNENTVVMDINGVSDESKEVQLYSGEMLTIRRSPDEINYNSGKIFQKLYF